MITVIAKPQPKEYFVSELCILHVGKSFIGSVARGAQTRSPELYIVTTEGILPLEETEAFCRKDSGVKFQIDCFVDLDIVATRKAE